MSKIGICCYGIHDTIHDNGLSWAEGAHDTAYDEAHNTAHEEAHDKPGI